jgi:hypothetical protein
MKKFISRFMTIAGGLMILAGILQECFHKEYLMREYGFSCRNVCNQVSSSFEIKEPTKVKFQFYSKAEGTMSVSVRDSANQTIFQADNTTFDSDFSKELPVGVYYYDISYDGICGDFELYAAIRSLCGIVF